MVSVELGSMHSSASLIVQAHVLRALTTILPTFHLSGQSWPHLEKLNLADPRYLEPREIDIILGADYYGSVMKPNIIKHSSTMPIAQLSIFGWLVLGPVHSSSTAVSAVHHLTSKPDEEDVHQLLTKFWVQEEIQLSLAQQLTPEEIECETHFQNTHKRDSDGRYVVRLPLKSSATQLGNSLNTARRCLNSMVRRLNKDPELKQLYTSFMKEYEALGHMKRVETHQSHIHLIESHGDGPSEMTLAHEATASGGLRVSGSHSSMHKINHQPYYLPHHGVLKPDSTSTKLRVVFNGSSPTSSGCSVNDIMHTGANLHLEISDVLIWIRQYQHIFATDVTKMYRQVKIHEADWDLQRILWINETQQEVAYHLTTVTYGTRAAPFLAVRALLQLAKDEGENYPLAVPPITRGRYVDDIFGGADSLDKLKQIAIQLNDLCRAGGFPLAKWFATHPELIKSVAGNQDSSPISFDDCSTKILGLKWLPQRDTFSFSSTTHLDTRAINKRIILSEVARIFDPLGFASPVVIKAKVLLQELWIHNLQWDDKLPSQFIQNWLLIREDLKSLARLSIPRWFNTLENSIVELHGFSDASQLAMAAVVYITVKSSSTNTMTSFVCAKTKVAPIKKLTIPRLELSAALLLSKLIKYVLATLDLNVVETHLWTDSLVTLAWIKTHPSRWKEYVRNRVTQIQELTPNAHWRHVPGSSNPADCASRGLTTSQLENHHLWWTGPLWITQPMENWPSQSSCINSSTNLEARPGVSLVTAVQKKDYHWDLIYRYSSMYKLLKLTALCFRITSYLRRLPITLPVIHISVVDLDRAKSFWIESTQAAYFTHELNVLESGETLPRSHHFTRLTAFIDTDGIIRVGGRLSFSTLNYEAKHPAILPRHSKFTSLVIGQAHLKTLHGGTQLTLGMTRQSYWIIGGRASVKSHVLKCVNCARQRGIRAQQLMGQLPLCRVTPSRPFQHTGVDYAGPIILKSAKGRGIKTQKGWICVFVCMATSTVHLEVVTDYSTEGFFSVYRRFIARRGIPNALYSDCGTNFKGADATLQQLFRQHSQENQHLMTLVAQERTQWRFNPPAAPHMGGKWEAVVKSIKFHLRRTLNETLLTYEEYSTLLTQIEAVLNSRPLEPLSDDPEDLSVLTPGHFLIGCPLNTQPESSLLELNSSRLNKWQLIQQKLQQFWRQWSMHYLQRQQSISKWHHARNDLKEGSIVLITDERLPPSKWPLARILKLHPGRDGHTRVVTLKTSTTILTRPVSKLAILPVISTEENHQPTG